MFINYLINRVLIYDMNWTRFMPVMYYRVVKPCLKGFIVSLRTLLSGENGRVNGL